MAHLIEIAIAKGGSGYYEFTLAQNGVALNLTGKGLTFTVAPYAGGTPSFAKKNAVAGGSDAQIEMVDAVNGVVKVWFVEADTLSLAAGVYVCDMWMDDGADHIQVVEVTPFRVKARAKATS